MRLFHRFQLHNDLPAIELKLGRRRWLTIPIPFFTSYSLIAQQRVTLKESIDDYQNGLLSVDEFKAQMTREESGDERFDGG